ncbi:hypothetical protein GR160_04340 [Flavobacterium sp. Sd200]|uniref:transglutaminase domain-containing protein n=1 Tax=Flavobacterium sp. Sd200 TaxID=2692211 RepID=UPI001371CEF0|nr:transglutaminase domain-containing protein [Flavobacterium sp. Sd200]MXN90447.1 hypothetical protein [Flavobacterium sp. Sd200]
MKKISKYLYHILFLITGIVNAQDFTTVDNTVKAYPKFTDIDKLTAQINKDFKKDGQKARALFTWIALNIKYDLAAYGVNEQPVVFSYSSEAEKIQKQKKFKEDLAVKTIRTKKGVCEGYSTLYLVAAEKLGLETVMIPGTSKSHQMHIGKAPGRSDHTWNAVKINGEWKLLDTTWGAGVVTGEKPAFNFKFNDGYFFTEPDKFFLNHYPDDEKWLLTKKTANDFANLPLYYGNYLMGNYDFISPKMGTFTDKKYNVIPFKIANLKAGDAVHYAFSKDRKIVAVNEPLNGDTIAFDVPLDASSNGTLTIYINQKSVAAYRINR